MIRTLIALIAFPIICQGGRRLVWEFNLTGRLKDARGELERLPHSIRALSFSPDETRLAVSVGLHEGEKNHTSHLVVFTVDDPTRSLRQIETGNYSTPRYLSEHDALSWSERGDHLIVRGSPRTRVVNLREHTQCVPPGDINGFVGDQMIGKRGGFGFNPRGVHPSQWKSRLEWFGPDCQAAASWEIDENWVLKETIPGRGLVRLSRYLTLFREAEPELAAREELIVLDANTRKVLRRWPLGNFKAPHLRLAEGGKSLCGGTIAQSSRSNVELRCWDLTTGTLIAEHPRVKGGVPFSVTPEATLVAAFDWDKIPTTPKIKIPEDLAGMRIVIWDFRAGRDLASWKPALQKMQYTRWKGMPMEIFIEILDDPFVFALSPKGRYLAEGGDDVIRLYAIE